MIWLIGLGGSLGAAARYLLGNLVNKKAKNIYPFPAGTWVINVTGSFLLGWIANLHLTGGIDDWVWLFGGVGFCGAYTTFSTFGNETITLIQSNQMKSAVIYVMTSVIVGCVSAAVGLAI
ncbi:fluoride efflux transporter CrcB [Bacillus sp. B190/17]|uniref:Fluoride-specific ion channel FluC n=1 Tax=Bacillus lumedeiriae TaxID=3058829 RepID=A0ABW8I770_9BACI